MAKEAITIEPEDTDLGTLYSGNVKEWFPNLRQERIDEYIDFVNGYVAISKELHNKNAGNSLFINNLALYASSNFFTSAENNGYKSLYYFNFETQSKSKNRNIEIIVNKLRNNFVKVLQYEDIDPEQKIDSFYTSILSYTKSELQKSKVEKNLEINYEDKKTVYPTLENKIRTIDKDNKFSKYKNEKLAGNRDAKKQLYKAIDFLLCYDPDSKKNHLLELIDFPKIITLMGKSGVGKTMLITKALNYLSKKAEELDKPFHLYKVDADVKSEYRSLSERQLKKKFDLTRKKDSINILLFEELDTKIFSRNNISQNHIGELSYTGTFLECLNGMQEYAGNYNIIATSNRMIDCDPALRRRLMEGVIYMNGLEKQEDHVLVFKNKLRKGIDYGYVQIKNWQRIAERSLQYKFQGGDIKNISRGVMNAAAKNISFTSKEDYLNSKNQLNNIDKIDDKSLMNYLRKYYHDKKNFTKDYLGA